MSWDVLREKFEAAANAATLWTWPKPLGEASRHALFGGGKRVRPLLALLGAEAAGGDADAALPWGVAVEMVHTYSLVHDDLPAMDDDDERRGRPTVHKAYDEAVAILAGDALLTDAFRVLAEGYPDARCPQLVGLLAVWAGGQGMIGGQVLDIAGTASLDALVEMQRLKTGALIRIAVAGGALAAGKSDAVVALNTYGDALGLLFQVTDDILDREQDAERDGNNYFHHLSEAQVMAKRDALLKDAVEALATLPKPDALAEFARYVAHRTV